MPARIEFQTRAQVRRMCLDFLTSRYKGEAVNAIQAAREIAELWAVSIDWHEFTNVLETMVAYESAEYAGVADNGAQNYIIR